MDVKNNKIKTVFICMFLSLLLICGLIFATDSNIFIINTGCLWLLGFIYLFIVLYCIASHKIKDIVDHAFLFWAVSVVVSVFMMCILPFQYSKVLANNIFEKKMIQSKNLIIEPLDEKNENSSGYTVCIEGIVLDGVDYNMYEIPLSDGWEFVDGRPCAEGMAGKLNIDVSKTDNYKLLVRKNQESGKIRVYMDGDSRVYDLYGEEAVDRETLDLSLIAETERNGQTSVGKEIIYYICYFVVLFSITVLAGFYYLKYKNRKNVEDV